MLQATAIEAGQQSGGRLVVQMPVRPADARLQGRRISAVREHVQVVVALQNQAIAAPELRLDMRGDVPDISEQAEASCAVRKHELARFARIVRNGVGMQFDITYREAFVTAKLTKLRHGVTDRCAKRVQGAGRHPQRYPVAASERTSAVRMVAVLMGEHNGRQLVRVDTETRQTSFGFPEAEAAIDQQPRIPALDQQGIAATAATEQRKAK
jgi:hypothetical protein